MLQDFKRFVLRGNVADLAVALIIGVAFTAFTRLQQRRASGELAEAGTPVPSDEALLHAEIRDLLRAGR